MNCSGLQIKSVDRVAFTQRQPQIAIAVEIQRAWAIERRAHNLCASGRRFLFSCAGKGCNEARLQIKLADAVIEDVANVKIATRIKLDAMRLIEHSFYRRAAITGKSRLTRSGNGR